MALARLWFLGIRHTASVEINSFKPPVPGLFHRQSHGIGHRNNPLQPHGTTSGLGMIVQVDVVYLGCHAEMRGDDFGGHSKTKPVLSNAYARSAKFTQCHNAVHSVSSASANKNLTIGAHFGSGRTIKPLFCAACNSGNSIFSPTVQRST